MRLLLFFIILFFQFQSGSSQINNKVKSNLQNRQWFEALKKLTKDSQLHAIRERIVFDTSISLSAPFPPRFICRSGMESSEVDRIYLLPVRKYDSANLSAFPLWYFYFGNSALRVSKILPDKNFQLVMALLNPGSVSTMTVLGDINNAAAMALFGFDGYGGVVMFQLKNKRVLRKLKRLTKDYAISNMINS